jgi:hypothetical protein
VSQVVRVMGVGMLLGAVLSVGLVTPASAAPHLEPDVISGHRTWSGEHNTRMSTPRTLGVLRVPAGTWVGYATLSVFGGGGKLSCTLRTGTTRSADHHTGVLTGAHSDESDAESLSVNTTHTFGRSGGAFSLVCSIAALDQYGVGDVNLHRVNMVAVRVQRLTKRTGTGTPVTVGSGTPAAEHLIVDTSHSLPGGGADPLTIGSLALGAGTWWVRGTISLRGTVPCTDGGHCPSVRGTCTLAGDSGSASGSVSLQTNEQFGYGMVPDANKTITVDLIETAATTHGTVGLRCGSSRHLGDAVVRNARVTAIRVGTLTDGSPPVMSGAGTPVVASIRQGPSVAISQSWTTVAQLPFPTDSDWLVMARLTVPLDVSDSHTRARCRLLVGSDVDDVSAANGRFRDSMVLMVTHAAGDAPVASASLRCMLVNWDTPTTLQNIALTAIRAATVTHVSIKP